MFVLQMRASHEFGKQYVLIECASEAVFFSKIKKGHLINKAPLNRGTVAIPLLCLAHEKDTTHFTAFK